MNRWKQLTLSLVCVATPALILAQEPVQQRDFGSIFDDMAPIQQRLIGDWVVRFNEVTGQNVEAVPGGEMSGDYGEVNGTLFRFRTIGGETPVNRLLWAKEGGKSSPTTSRTLEAFRNYTGSATFSSRTGRCR